MLQPLETSLILITCGSRPHCCRASNASASYLCARGGVCVCGGANRIFKLVEQDQI